MADLKRKITVISNTAVISLITKPQAICKNNK